MSFLDAVNNTIRRLHSPRPPKLTAPTALVPPLVPSPASAPAPAAPMELTRSVCKSPHHKRHRMMADGKPLCGGGNGAKSAHGWQEDITPANCEACNTIWERRKQ